MDVWKPSTTVAAIVERDGRLLVVEEHTREGLRINQPAGHLDPGESLIDAAVRETLEETAWHVEPVAFLGTYMARYRSAPRPGEPDGVDVTYLRFAFLCRALSHEPDRPLDEGIVRALWLTPEELEAERPRHRSPLVWASVGDFLRGRRFPLDMIHTDPSCITR